MLKYVIIAILVAACVADDPDQPKFNDKNRPILRGIWEEEVTMPCQVLNTKSDTKVVWRRLGGPDISEDSSKGRIVHDPDRYEFKKQDKHDSFYLIIKKSTVFDAGFYECVVFDSRLSNPLVKRFDLVLTEKRRCENWRSDRKCRNIRLDGNSTDPSNLDAAACDPYGTFPCCSKWGFCGFTDKHCNKPGNDYSRPQGLEFMSLQS